MTEPDDCTPDYAAMSDGDMLKALGDDARAWAAAFCQAAHNLGFSEGVDKDWVCSWFANAIEHSEEVRLQRSKPAATIVDLGFWRGKK